MLLHSSSSWQSLPSMIHPLAVAVAPSSKTRFLAAASRCVCSTSSSSSSASSSSSCCFSPSSATTRRALSTSTSAPSQYTTSSFSSSSSPPPPSPPPSPPHSSAAAYQGHIPVNAFQKTLLAAGSAITSLLDPYRHDMVAVLGETTSGRQLPKMREALLKSEEGLRILSQRPRLNSNTIDVARLARLPEQSLGRAYVDWLEACKVTPDTREPVRYVDDPELAYIMQRYRECHDFYHVLLGFPVSVSAELVVKWFEMANMGLPVAVLSSTFGPLRLKASKRRRLASTYLPWALRTGSSASSLISVFWEERWQMNIDDLRRELGIAPPPMTWREYRASS